MKPEQNRVIRAKELLQTAKHGCMATTNEDGTPHATPFYLIFDEDLQCMDGADITAFWVNVAERDDEGRLLREYRHEVSRDELLGVKT